jgi:hypothetical protein
MAARHKAVPKSSLFNISLPVRGPWKTGLLPRSRPAIGISNAAHGEIFPATRQYINLIYLFILAATASAASAL